MWFGQVDRFLFIFVLKLIAEIELEMVLQSPSLTELNLEENPLSRSCEASLGQVTKINIVYSKRDLEEWEDLTIWLEGK